MAGRKSSTVAQTSKSAELQLGRRRVIQARADADALLGSICWAQRAAGEDLLSRYELEYLERWWSDPGYLAEEEIAPADARQFVGVLRLIDEARRMVRIEEHLVKSPLSEALAALAKAQRFGSSNHV